MGKIKTCIGCYSCGTSDDMSDCWKCNDYSYYEEDDEFTEIKKQIRADAIDDAFNSLLLMVKNGYDYPNAEFEKMFIALVEDAIDSVKENLKGAE